MRLKRKMKDAGNAPGNEADCFVSHACLSAFLFSIDKSLIT